MLIFWLTMLLTLVYLLLNPSPEPTNFLCRGWSDRVEYAADWGRVAVRAVTVVRNVKSQPCVGAYSGVRGGSGWDGNCG